MTWEVWLVVGVVVYILTIAAIDQRESDYEGRHRNTVADSRIKRETARTLKAMEGVKQKWMSSNSPS